MENQNQQPRQSDTHLLKPLWQGIWNLKVPSKVKNLIWRVAKNSLPTKQNLLRRKIIIINYSDQCQSQHEDVLHALYLCPKLEEFCQSHRMYFGGEQGPRAVCYGGVSSVEEKK